jgi:hypothetical protein
MKTFWAFLSFVCGGSGVCLPVAAQSIDPAEILRKYSPHSLVLVERYHQAPRMYEFTDGSIELNEAESWERYLDKTDEFNLLASLPVAVHEICHGYTSRNVFQELQKISRKLPDPGKHYLFYLDSTKSVLVHVTQVYRTSEIHQTVPDHLKTFRYETYIFPSSDIGAQMSGVYGLMDEWNAYYQDTRTILGLYDYYLQLQVDERFAVLEFLKSINSSYLAYAEFRYYILKYLLYAREHHQQVFFEVLANRSFLEAFNEIDRRFGTVVDNYFKLKERIRKRMLDHNITYREDERFIYLGQTGVGNFLDYYLKLTEEMERKEYQDLLLLLKD